MLEESLDNQRMFVEFCWRRVEENMKRRNNGCISSFILENPDHFKFDFFD